QDLTAEMTAVIRGSGSVSAPSSSSLPGLSEARQRRMIRHAYTDGMKAPTLAESMLAMERQTWLVL
ncbi:hypothetical protein ACFLSW_04265, partial [Candidatus Bipolaricaulota bacterium]